MNADPRVPRQRGPRRWVEIVGCAPLLALVAMSACSQRTDALQRELDSGMATWESQGPAAYTISYERRCLCANAGSFVARVEDGSVISVDPERGVGGDDEMPHALTVEALFEVVRSAIDRGADRIEVEYDPAVGYPRSITIDRDAGAEDDELVISAQLDPG